MSLVVTSRPRRATSQATALLCDAVAIIAVATALAAVVGWVIGSPTLVQVLPSYPPLDPGSALGLVTLAAGAWGLAHRSPRWVIVGAGVGVLLGGLALVLSAAGVDLGRVDQVFSMPPVPGAPAGIPLRGRMAASTAVCFLLTAVALLLGLARARRWRAGGSALVATVVGAFGLVSFVCYAGGMLDEFRFDVFAGMPIQASLGFGLIGGALIAVAWGDEAAAGVGALPNWAPWAAGMASLTITVFVWRALVTQHRRQLVAETRAQAVVARHDLERATDALVTTVRVLPSTAPLSPDTGEAWPGTVRRLLTEVPGMIAALRTDRSLNVENFKTSASDSTLSRALRAALRARETPSGRLTRDSVLVGVAPTTDRQRLFTLAVPICGGGECTGYVVVLLNAQRFLADALHGSTPGYYVIVSARGDRLFRPADTTPTGKSLTQVVSLDLGALHLDIEVWPTDDRLAVVQPELPDLVAALGLLLSGLLVLTFWLVRRSLLQARLEERARMGLAFETATDGVWEWDVRSGTGTVSDALWRRLGYDPIELPMLTSLRQWRALVHPDDERRLQQALERHLTGESSSVEVEYRIKAKDGDWHTIVERGRVADRDIRGRPLIVLGIAADVTERKRADEALAANERRFRAMFDSAFQFQCLLDLDGRCLEANRAALDFAGLSMDDLRGRRLWDVPWWAGPEQRERIQQACTEAAGGRTVRYEAEWLGRAGPALIDFSIKPILNGEGRVSQLLAEGRDVTDRRRTENAMREMEALSSMGRLAARVAHEVNNPLAGIQNSFLLIKDAVPETHPYHSYVGAIEREIGRISAVTRQLYETYRPDPDGRQESSVQTILSDAATLLRQVNRGAKVTVDVETAGVPPKLPVPGALLRQAAYNLVQNAIEASPPGGVVKVVAKVEDSTFSLSVCDQGPGVPAHLREQIFAPFFSTKSGGRTSGMGLGLALVRRSVDALGGHIELTDRPEGGTEFRVQIPLPHGEESR